jgi:hypothetical protein
MTLESADDVVSSSASSTAVDSPALGGNEDIEIGRKRRHEVERGGEGDLPAFADAGLDSTVSSVSIVVLIV